MKPMIAMTVMLATAACADVVDGTCRAPADAPAPIAAGADLQTTTEHDALVELDNLFGRFFRKEVVVYSGTVTVKSKDVSGTQASLDHVDAIALLVTGAQTKGTSFAAAPSPLPPVENALVIHTTTDSDHVLLVQLDATTTFASAIAPGRDGAQLDASCTSCAPDLSTKPAHVALALDAAGSGDTTVDAELDEVDPCTLSFHDFTVLDTFTPAELFDFGLAQFDEKGGELTAPFDDGSSSAPRGCRWQTTSHAELFVDANDLAHYGVRSYGQDFPSYICPP